jgi:hypothetical protein
VLSVDLCNQTDHSFATRAAGAELCESKTISHCDVLVQGCLKDTLFTEHACGGIAHEVTGKDPGAKLNHSF